MIFDICPDRVVIHRLGWTAPEVAITTTDQEKQKRAVRKAYFEELWKRVGPWTSYRLYELKVLDNGVYHLPSLWGGSMG